MLRNATALFLLTCSTGFGAENEKLQLDHSKAHPQHLTHKRQHTEHIYNFKQAEVHRFIGKVLQKGLTVRNDTDIPLKIKLKAIKDGIPVTTIIKLKENVSFNGDKEAIFYDVKLDPPRTTLFLNIEDIVGGQAVYISSRARPVFPRFIGPYDFSFNFLEEKPKDYELVPFAPQYRQLRPNNLTEEFTLEFERHIHFLVHGQFKQEHFTAQKYISRLNSLYNENNFAILYQDPSFDINTHTLRIPKIIHTIWITNSATPIPLPERYISWLLTSIKNCPVREGYKHWLWVKKKNKLEEMIKTLEKHDVEIHELKELKKDSLDPIIQREYKNNRFGRVSDILRLLILYKHGGVYKDTDYRIDQSLTPLLKLYDFVAAQEPMSYWPCNAFIAAVPEHPIIKKYMELILRNYDERAAPEYITKTSDADGFKTIILTGPAAFANAIMLTEHDRHNRNIVLPYPYIYPTPVGAHPQKRVVKPDEPVPPSAFGVHFWETSWANKDEFKSNG